MFTRTLIGLAAAMILGTPAGAVAGPPVPGAFKGLKPYQVVEQIMVQREGLNLSEQQFARLDALSLEVRGEQRRFTHRGGKPHRTRHVRMTSRGEAFARAMAVLTPEQQGQVQTLFSTPAPIRSESARQPTRPRGKP